MFESVLLLRLLEIFMLVEQELPSSITCLLGWFIHSSVYELIVKLGFSIIFVPGFGYWYLYYSAEVWFYLFVIVLLCTYELDVLGPMVGSLFWELKILTWRGPLDNLKRLCWEIFHGLVSIGMKVLMFFQLQVLCSFWIICFVSISMSAFHRFFLNVSGLTHVAQYHNGLVNMLFLEHSWMGSYTLDCRILWSSINEACYFIVIIF